MIRVIPASQTPRLSELHKNAPKARVLSSWRDTPVEVLDEMRDARVFREHYTQSDVQLLNCDVLLYSGDRNKVDTVLMLSPAGCWVDVTQADNRELFDVSAGLIAVDKEETVQSQQPTPVPSAGNEDALGTLLGMALYSFLKVCQRR